MTLFRIKPIAAYLALGVLVAILLVACDSAAPPSPTPIPPATARPATATAAPARAAATATLPLPSATPAGPPATATADQAALAVYATITALAGADAAAATAAAGPTATPPPAAPAPPVPATAFGTYDLIVTARAEGHRIYREAGTLVLRAPRAGSGHSAELTFQRGVRSGREYHDLSPGTTVGGLYLTTSAALLPAGFPAAGPFAVAVVYNPATKYLTVTGDPAHGFPGGWSTGAHNTARTPRPISAGTLVIDLGRAGHATGQFDLRSLPASGPALLYSGGFAGDKR